MYDFIKSINLSDELKTSEIYNLFKTNSSKLNLNILSSLQEFHKTNEFLNYYTKQDCQNAFNLFNELSLFQSKICEKNTKINFNLEVDKYLSEISKIIFLFLLIQKNIELLTDLIDNTNRIISKFYFEKHQKINMMKEALNNCINDLINSSQFVSQRNYSRRSTKDLTISSSNLLFGENFGNYKKIDNNNSKEESFLLFQCCTPKFEEDEEEKENNEGQNIEIKKEFKDDNSQKGSGKTIKTIGSSLSFRNLKITYDSDEEEERTKKKNKTIKMGLNYTHPKFFFKKKSLSNKNKEKSFNNDLKSENIYNKKSIEKTKIIAQFLSVIKVLFKNGKINSQQKINIKESIITDSEKIIDEYIYFNKTKKNFNNINIKYIQKFLLEKVKNMK